MEWKLTEEQETYRDTMREWLASVAPMDVVRSWCEDGDLAQFSTRLHDEGWWGVGVAEDSGGQGGGVVELALTAEELGRACVPSGAWLATILTLPAHGQLPGEASAWLCPAELPPSGTPILKVDGDGQVSGSASRVLAGADASDFVAVVDVDGVPRLVTIDARGDGVAVRPRSLLDRSRSVADVSLDHVPYRLLEGDVAAALARAADLAAVLVAADSLGAMERMLDLAVEYSQQRQQFGVPIGSFQAVKHAAAGIEVAVESGRSAIYFAAGSVEAGTNDCALHAAAVKAQVTAEGNRAADTALTMHGAIGYTWEHDLHLFYKRARLNEFLLGDPHLWNERIADGLALV